MVVNNIWKKGGVPEDWNKGISNPIKEEKKVKLKIIEVLH